MKISASNIAWETKDMDKHLSILKEYGADGLELSPSMIWPEPINALSPEIENFRLKVKSYGLEIPSIHSLTYSRPELKIFESPESRLLFSEYIINLGRLSNQLECPYMVYGSAGSRKIGEKNKADCISIFVETFFNIAEKLKPLGVCLLIEYLSPTYTDFINNATEAVNIINMINHPNIKLHLDIRSSIEINEDPFLIWSKYGDLIKSCHTGNPPLDPPSSKFRGHYLMGEAMRSYGYKGYVSIEMLRKKNRTERNLINAIKFVRKVYLNA